MCILLYIFLLVFISLVGFGIYLTAMAYQKDHTKSPAWVVNHLKQLKWVGPSTMVVGFLGAFLMVYSIMKHHTVNVEVNNMAPNMPKSSFGFRYY